MPNLALNTNMSPPVPYFVGFTARMAGGPTFTAPSGKTFSGNLISVDRTSGDAFALLGAGWVPVADHSGTTAQRPVDLEQGGALPPGFRYHDTTLSAVVVWTPRGWINPLTGASA